MAKLKTATIRDFGGGWNAADNDLSIKSRYLAKSKNVVVETDNSIRVRPGSRLIADVHNGTEVNIQGTFDIEVFSDNNEIQITVTGHGRSDGDHVTISGATSIADIPADDINRTHGIRVIDTDTIAIVVRTAATSSTTTSMTLNLVFDNHEIGGNIIDARYFQDYLVFVTDIGEIGRMNADWQFECIWSNAIAYSRAGNPNGWGATKRVSFASAKGTMLIVNGRYNDKPLEVDNTRANVVEYLVDPLTGSNADVPRGDWIIALNNYVIIGNSENGNGEVTLSISAKNTTGVYATNPLPDDAVDVDLTQVTTSIDPRITGLGFIRNKLLVTFSDSAILGTLGLYTEGAHEPDFSDLVAQHGCLNGRTLISLGNDVLMADYVGVPSIALSQLSGTFVPERVSELIAPVLQANIARLSTDTAQNNIFAIYDIRNKRYMLFVPKYDETTQVLPNNPFVLDSLLSQISAVLVKAPGHNLQEGDYVTVSGATDIGDLPATSINGRRRIIAVLDGDQIILEVGSEYSTTDTDLGGVGISITPVNDETIVYVYTNNQVAKALRWTSYRDLFPAWAAVSLKGRVFFGRAGKIYLFGSEEEPLNGDEIDEFDYPAWYNTTDYLAGDRVLVNGTIYRALVDNTAGSDYGTLAEYMNEHPDDWELYKGIPIRFEAETPWSDLGNRSLVKAIQTTTLDAPGRGEFRFEMYHDKIYRDPDTLELAPIISMTFGADDAYGFGQYLSQGFGGTRRTREQYIWNTPAYGKQFKIRFSGETNEPLKIAAVTISYTEGSAHR